VAGSTPHKRLQSEKDLLIGLNALQLEVPSPVWDDFYERATAYVKEANGLLEQLEAALTALREADRLASVAHDAIWDNRVEANSRLHDNEDELSAQTAIWQLHHTVRPLIADVSERAPSAAVDDPAEPRGETVGERQGRQPAPAPTEGLPPDLVRVLRDPTITIARDHEIRLADGRTLFEHLEEWRNAPSNTASADTYPTSESDE
jgi:hypothetical protein